MQTMTVSDNITFAYSDSGSPPDRVDFLTVIVIHGITFHSGTFSSMISAANSLGYRLIVPNRRLYPGSTPYTKEETDGVQPSSPIDAFVETLERQGRYLLEFCNNVIEEHSLKKVALAGWSMGSLFLTLTVGAIKYASEETKNRMKETVKAVISWDPASTTHGFAHPSTGDWTMPLMNLKLTPQERAQEAFFWATSYAPHPDLESKDFNKLIWHPIADPKRPRTFTDTSMEELAGMMDLPAAEKGDSCIGEEIFWPTTRSITDNAFFCKEIREAWSGAAFSVIYGDETVYNVVWSAWRMEDMSHRAGVPLTVKKIPGANHFVRIPNGLS